jgi:sulfatase modifying factor 1
VGAIGQSRVMVLVFSSHAIASDEVQREVVNAFQERVVVVPLRIEDIRPSGDMAYYMRTTHWLDAMTPPFAAHLQRLCQTVRVLLPTREGVRDPGPPGPFPPVASRRAGQTRDDNSLKTKLVWIPLGEFTMGSPKDEKDRFDDEDQVQVILTRGFWLGQHEITQAEWQRIMQTTPWNGKKYVKEGDDYPATYVNWDDAMKFCEKLTERERGAGQPPSDWQYTLPTEAQWECACRAGTKSRFSFGNDDSDLSDYAWWGGIVGDGNAKNELYAHIVGQKKVNPWGLSDMHGNVWEWCRDWHAEELTGGTDPQGPSEGGLRVRRGGCWSSSAGYCRSALRCGSTPGLRGYDLGFRVAAVPSGK